MVLSKTSKTQSNLAGWHRWRRNIVDGRGNINNGIKQSMASIE